MVEEIIETGTPQEPDYIEQIEQLRANSVPKEQYEKLRTEHNRAMNALINGGQIETPAEKIDKQALRKELYCEQPNLSNLDYWQKTLTLRKAIMDEGGNDPFLPYGQKIAATAEDKEAAERVATIVQECIDYADGNSRLFTQELDRRTIDVGPIMSRGRRR